MIKVIITSLNPAKINAVKSAFCAVFPDEDIIFEGIFASSGVSDQPLSCEETLKGAKNRVNNAKECVSADFYVGIEAGIEKNYTFAWMVIHGKDNQGESRSASLPLPPAALRGIEGGKELGDVMDEMFNQKNVKQQGGAIGMLTGALLSRSVVYHQALILALIPFIHPHLYRDA